MSISSKKIVKALKKSFPLNAKNKKPTKHEKALEETIIAIEHLINENHDEARKFVNKAYKTISRPLPNNPSLKTSIVLISTLISQNEESISNLSVEVLRLANEHLV